MFTRRKFLVLFVIINLILSSFFLDIWKNANTTSRALPIITFFEEGTFCIDKYHELTCDKSHINGHYYTDKAPLPTFFVLPVFGTMVKTGIITADTNGSLFGDHIYILGGFLAASLPFVLVILITYLKIDRRDNGISPVILIMLPFYASFLFVFTGSYFAHLFSGILLFGSYLYLKKKKYIISGIFAGMSFISEYNLAVIFVVWGLLMIYQYRSLKPVLQFGLGTLPSLVIILLYNYNFTGSPFEMLYQYHTFDQHSTNYGFMLPGLESVWGLSFSWYRGVFFFSPFLILLLLLAYREFNKKKSGFLTNNFLVLPSIVYFLFISSFFAWWGGWTYGPRFFTGLVILLTYEGIQYISKKPFNKPLFFTLVIFGILCAFMAKATIVYSAPTEEHNPLFNLVIPAFFNGDFNPNNVLTMLFNVRPVYSFIAFIVLFLGGISLLIYLYPKWQRQ